MNSKLNKTFITGLGVVSALGNNYDEHKNNLLKLNSGIKLKSFTNSKHSFESFVGKVSEENLNINDLKKEYSNLKFAIQAACEAINDANIEPKDYNNIGLVIGTSLGGKTESQSSYYKFLSGDHSFNQETSEKKLLQNIADEILRYLDIQATVFVISTACSASNNAVILGSQMIQSDYDLVIVGGTDCLADVSLSGFNSLSALNKNSHAKPYSSNYGISLGEGAGFVILENWKTANAKRIKCEIVSGAITSDSHHITAPDPQGRGANNVIHKTLQNGGIEYTQIDYINSHGTGTKANDTMELKLLSKLFDNTTSISSTKSLTGHTLGAAGIIELINTVIMMENDKIVGTLTNSNDNIVNSSFLKNTIQKKKINYALSLSFAFGGNNSCVLLSQYNSFYKKNNINYKLSDYSVKEITSNILVDNRLINPKLNGNYNLLKFDDSLLHGYQYTNLKNEYKIDPKIFRRIDDFSKLVVNTVSQAFNNCNLNYKKLEPEKIGVIFSTPMGPVNSVEQIERDVYYNGYESVSAKIFPYTVMNAAAGIVSQVFKIKGPVSVISSVGTGFIDCIDYSKHFIKNEDLDYVLLINASKVSEFEIFNWFEMGYDPTSHLTDLATVTILEKNKINPSIQFLDSRNLKGNNINIRELINHFLEKNKLNFNELTGLIWNSSKKIESFEFKELKNLEKDFSDKINIYNLSDLKFTSDGSGEELLYLYHHIKQPGIYLVIAYALTGGYALSLIQRN
ncbi:beta-ketoacyl synthase N-terminal-like domain-containing protein [Staphylococcus shinii]|uniref:beta-ketoacyl-[acyl-carrier-protein] synthase family protein n=1 Tax=Staphylococcus shinii TaxID=2912228 RepID=UPI003CF14F1F